MNAVPENVSIELFRVLVNKNDGTGTEWRLAAQTTINCGQVNHLEPGYLVQLTNLFCNRNRAGIDAYQRLTGGGSSTQTDLSNEAARENSVPANADFSQQVVYAPDAIDATRSLAMTHDATTGQIAVAQLKTSDGTNYTTGKIAPQYSGNGAPSATTLATSAYYRVSDRYFATSAKVEYICTTAGDKTSSVWVQLGGGITNRGLWAAGTYSLNDLVVVQSGAAAGTYLSTIGSNTNDPATGVGWLQIAPGNTVGNWS
jgi:hypothetical protein